MGEGADGLARLSGDRYPPLPDLLGEDVAPAPDGRAWAKACGRCAFSPGTDEHACTGLDRDAARRAGGGVAFFCVHRVDEDGRHRVCACWNACRSR